MVYGPPSARGGGLRALSLGPSGQREGEEVRLLGGTGAAAELAPQAEEIVAVADAGRLRIAWVERDQLAFRTRAMLTDATEPVASPVEELGPTTRERTGRGSLAMAAHEGAFELLYRNTDGPCAPGSSDRCARFWLHRSVGGDGEPTEGARETGSGLSIPTPCEVPVVGFASAAGVWYQALCSLENGAPQTTVFAFQFDPEYAHAAQAEPSCPSRTLAVAGDGVVLGGGCPDSESLWIGQAGRSIERLQGTSQILCEDDRTVWVQGAQRVPFGTPRARVEGLMPAGTISEQARAVWTGESVLVAELVGDELAVRRFECDAGSFRRTDHEAL